MPVSSVSRAIVSMGLRCRIVVDEEAVLGRDSKPLGGQLVDLRLWLVQMNLG